MVARRGDSPCFREGRAGGVLLGRGVRRRVGPLLQLRVGLWRERLVRVVLNRQGGGHHDLRPLRIVHARPPRHLPRVGRRGRRLRQEGHVRPRPRGGCRAGLGLRGRVRPLRREGRRRGSLLRFALRG